MTAFEALQALQEYFGPWSIPAVSEHVLKELRRYDDSELEAISNEIIRTRPANYGAPDVLSVVSAVKTLSQKRTLRLRSGARVNTRSCPVCKTVLSGTKYTCSVCGYDVADDVEEHARWWEDFKAGKAKRFTADDVLRKIVSLGEREARKDADAVMKTVYPNSCRFKKIGFSGADSR